MTDQDLICICMTVSRAEIIEAIRSGKHTLEDLKTALLCCTGCGTCEPRVREILETELKKLNSEQEVKKTGT